MQQKYQPDFTLICRVYGFFFIIVYCPKGQEGNVSCTMCPVNYIKPVAGISACAACEGNYTANADRDDCSKSR